MKTISTSVTEYRYGTCRTPPAFVCPDVKVPSKELTGSGACKLFASLEPPGNSIRICFSVISAFAGMTEEMDSSVATAFSE
ncbi:hypothetical protein KAU32_08815 [bacterium]|nr:hypothetical protein [bacterium]